MARLIFVVWSYAIPWQSGPSFVEPRFCLNMTEKNTLVLYNLMFQHHVPIKTAVNLIYSLFMFIFRHIQTRTTSISSWWHIIIYIYTFIIQYTYSILYMYRSHNIAIRYPRSWSIATWSCANLCISPSLVRQGSRLGNWSGGIWRNGHIIFTYECVYTSIQVRILLYIYIYTHTLYYTQLILYIYIYIHPRSNIAGVECGEYMFILVGEWMYG